MAHPVSPFIRAILNAQYLPSLATLDVAGLWQFNDVPYVADGNPKHNLDIIMASEPFPRKLQPVLLFFHGGGWQRGDKRYTLNLYWNVGVAAARAGAVGMICNYRLVPPHSHAEQLHDVGAAIRWAHNNARKYGGDPNKIILSGHSAGAQLAASWAATTPSSTSTPIRGFVGISGVYNILSLSNSAFEQPIVSPVFGDHEIDRKAASPVHTVHASSMLSQCSTLLVNAQEDLHLDKDAAELDNALAATADSSATPKSHIADYLATQVPQELQSSIIRGKHPLVTRAVIPNTNHMTIIGGIGHASDATTALLRAFIQSLR